LFRGVADGGQETDSGDYDSAGNNGSPLLRLTNAGNGSTGKPEAHFRLVAGLRKRLLLLAFNVGNGVTDGGDLLGFFVGNLKLERFFKRHDKFHDVQRIGAEIIDERRFIVHLAFIYAELFDNDLLNLLLYGRCHDFLHYSLGLELRMGRKVLILHQWGWNGACKDRNITRSLCVVLVSPRNPLNIGAAARAMANFGQEDLRVVNPYEPAFREAVSAVGGAHVLQAARVFPGMAEAVGDCSLVVGTTAAQKRELQVPIELVSAGMPALREHPGRVALVFGSEKFGLSNDDMSFCHTLLRIPTAPGTPSMNLGQAVAVCLYEYTRSEDAPPVRREADSVEGAEVEQMVQMLLEVLQESGYTNRITAVSTEQKIRRWVRRMQLGRRDVPLMLGILRQVLWRFTR
jgi:TrmH family RNA methyltransferase